VLVFTVSADSSIGGSGNTPIVSKQVGPGRLLGKTNWNTDFIVDRPYASYRFLFRANSSSPKATYPVEGTMKFSDGLQLPDLGGGVRLSEGPGRPQGFTSMLLRRLVTSTSG
jgi:hypothetical protein